MISETGRGKVVVGAVVVEVEEEVVVGVVMTTIVLDEDGVTEVVEEVVPV